MINFKVSKQDGALIEKIIARAEVDGLFEKGDRFRAHMDITCVHANEDGPLRLADLLAADDFNFTHDITGIQRHLDRSRGRLEGHFLPRFTGPKVAP